MIGTWQEGDELTFHGSSRKQEVFPGLFWYSGLGMGTFFAPGGQKHWCPKSESEKLASIYRVQWTFVDSFEGFTPISIKD